MNNDESTFEIPDYILSRLQPTLNMSMPSYADELEILRYHLPFSEEEFLKMTVYFLQKSHQLDLEFSPRAGTIFCLQNVIVLPLSCLPNFKTL